MRRDAAERHDLRQEFEIPTPRGGGGISRRSLALAPGGGLPAPLADAVARPGAFEALATHEAAPFLDLGVHFRLFVGFLCHGGTFSEHTPKVKEKRNLNSL
jgi:hypothetical protein